MTGGATKEEKDYLDEEYPDRYERGGDFRDVGGVRDADYLENMYKDLDDQGFQDWSEDRDNMSYESTLIEETYTIAGILEYDKVAERWRDVQTGRFARDPESHLF